MQFSKIKHDYIWGPLVEPSRPYTDENGILAGISIDTWKSSAAEEAGCVVANIILTAHGDMVTDFHDNGVRMNSEVLSHIRAAKSQLKELWDLHRATPNKSAAQCSIKSVTCRTSTLDAAPPCLSDEEGVCPLCGAELKYNGAHDIDDDGGTIPWECTNCGATGAEGYNRVFDQHYNVCDASGRPVPGRKV